jgi:hypothetical protein
MLNNKLVSFKPSSPGLCLDQLTKSLYANTSTGVSLPTASRSRAGHCPIRGGRAISLKLRVSWLRGSGPDRGAMTKVDEVRIHMKIKVLD